MAICILFIEASADKGGRETGCELTKEVTIPTIPLVGEVLWFDSEKDKLLGSYDEVIVEEREFIQIAPNEFAVRLWFQEDIFKDKLEKKELDSLTKDGWAVKWNK